ncbi:ISAs1 family transposase [Candidatus Poribacteria bacterium]|nr:ISAs1 family transposase [Candidatus Poribacteria bacterium]
MIDMLAELEDPRNDKGKRHPLTSILALIVIGLMCGHKGWTSIATWARSQPALTKALGFTHKKTPSASTIHNLLKKLNIAVLEETLTKWINTVLAGRPDLNGCFDAVAIDGKTMRASQKCGAKISHLLSAVSHELGITLTQRSVSDKTNEIPIKQVADVSIGLGPNTINRENVSRRIVIQCNVQDRDLGNFIGEVQEEIEAHISIPEAYFLTYGGQFESQQRAQRRILIQTGFVFIGIFILLYLAMGSMRLSILVILNLPLVLIGGVVSVFLTGGVLSIPSMVGFILLFGIAVRNGIILVSHINVLRSEGMSLYDAVIKGHRNG